MTRFVLINNRQALLATVIGICCGMLYGCLGKHRRIESLHSSPKTVRLSALISPKKFAVKAKPATPRPKANPIIRKLSRNKCYQLLKQHRIEFESIHRRKAAGIRMPIRLKGTIKGFRIQSRNKQKKNGYLDCRLAVAMMHWVKILARHGFTGIEYSSIYRPNARVSGSSKFSGHAHGMAIDVGKFVLGGKRTLDVLEDWEERDRGDEPCSREYDEPVQSQLMRRVVCEASTRKLFQVVLTPHHDRAHANHIHLELVPDVGWEYIR